MLFPAIKSSSTWRLPVSDEHTLYLEESGNPAGIPVVFLHGGPGASCGPSHRRFFDPEKYRIILFDQRGCGKSKPHASLANNTTWDSIADLEKIRVFLKIDQWVVFGGSWGSTLALAYAISYSEKVLGLILRGIFLAREKDVDWFFRGDAARIQPEAWARFIDPIPLSEQDDIVAAYYSRLTSKNEIIRMGAAKAWSVWEGSSITLMPDNKLVSDFSDPHFALSIARIECHYFMNQSFFEPNYLLRNAYKLKNIPGFIVHGRYDMVCPIDQALLLHQSWSGSQLRIISNAGHAASEPGINHALVDSCNQMLGLLV
jgi:proline iminopeptidase